MNGTPHQAPRRHRILVRTCCAFGFVAIALAIAALVVVERTMAAFRI
jgi:hypothetical protein